MGDEGQPRHISETRADAARASNAAKNAANWHPMFVYAMDERTHPIAFVRIARHDPSGRVECPRVFPADELESEEALMQLYGGGHYDLHGLAAHPDSGRPGAIVKTRKLTLPGASKPLTPEAPQERQPASTPTAAGLPQDPLAAMLVLQAQDRQEARAAEERRTQREEARAAQHGQLLASAIQAVAGIVGALLARPQPAPPPPMDIASVLAASAQLAASQTAAIASFMPRAGDPLDTAQKFLEVAGKLKPQEAGAKAGESLGDLMAGFGTMMAGVAEAEAARTRSGSQPPQPAPGFVPMMVPPSMPPPPSEPAPVGAFAGAPMSEAAGLAAA